VWLIIAFYYHKKIVFSFSGAKEISRKDNPEIYNIVENLCISCGLPTPKI
jgi:heat shock protein HtpX